jgi:hypothetical protein
MPDFWIWQAKGEGFKVKEEGKYSLEIVFWGLVFWLKPSTFNLWPYTPRRGNGPNEEGIATNLQYCLDQIHSLCVRKWDLTKKGLLKGMNEEMGWWGEEEKGGNGAKNQWVSIVLGSLFMVTDRPNEEGIATQGKSAC